MESGSMFLLRMTDIYRKYYHRPININCTVSKKKLKNVYQVIQFCSDPFKGQLWGGGANDYVKDRWNVMDFFMNSLYLATISTKFCAFYMHRNIPQDQSGNYKNKTVSDILYFTQKSLSHLM